MSTPAGHLKSAVPRLVVLAKAPQPGLSKTRLCPPLSSHEAADLAEIALIATLQAVMSTPGCEPMLVLEGPVGSWTPSIEVLPQRGITLGERLTAAFDDAHGPALVVGMDTPQVTPELLTEGLNHLRRPDLDAVFGPTTDGGYWAVGLKKAPSRSVRGRTHEHSMDRGGTAGQLRTAGSQVRHSPRIVGL